MTLDQLLRLCKRLLNGLDVRGATPRGLAVAMGLGEHVVLTPGQTLYAEGESNDAMFVLLTGQVDLLLNDAGGQPQHLTTIQAPALVGQVGIIERTPRDATCQGAADQRAGLVRLDRELVALTYNRADEVGAAVRRLIGASLLRRLADAHLSLKPAPAPAPAPPKPQPPESRPTAPAAEPDPDLAWLSGTIDGWAVDAAGLDDMELVETAKRPPRKGDR